MLTEEHEDEEKSGARKFIGEISYLYGVIAINVELLVNYVPKVLLRMELDILIKVCLLFRKCFVLMTSKLESAWLLIRRHKRKETKVTFYCYLTRLDFCTATARAFFRLEYTVLPLVCIREENDLLILAPGFMWYLFADLSVER